MIYNALRALALLRLGSGQPNVRFREGQEEPIRHIVEGRGRLLVVQKTGWGKFLFERPAWAHVPGTPGSRGHVKAAVQQAAE